MVATGYDDLIPTKTAEAPEEGAYEDLVPRRESTLRGGPPLRLPSFSESMEGLSEAAPELAAVGKATARGGKTLLAAMADLATLFPGGSEPGVENLRSYAANPEGRLPVEEGLSEMHGLSSVPTKAAAGLIRAVPAIGASMVLGGAGLPAPVAAALPMSANEAGELDPKGAAVGALLPGVTALGERAVVAGLSRLPMKEVALVIARDPLRIKGKVVQKFGPLNLSDDTFRSWMEAGGGAAAANAFLLATQAPEIAALPPEARGEAVLDAIAGNIGPSLIGFSARRPLSMTLERMAPDILRKGLETFGRKPQEPPPPRGVPEPHPSPDTTGPEGRADTNPPAPAPTPDMVVPGVKPAEAPPVVAGGPPPTGPIKPAATPVQEAAPQTAPAPPAVSTEQEPTTATVKESLQVAPEPPQAPPIGSLGAADPYADLVSETPPPSTPTVGEETPPSPEPEPGAADPEETLVPTPRPEVAQPEVAPPDDGPNVVANYVRNTLNAGNTVHRDALMELGQQFGMEEREVEEWAELGSAEAARKLIHQGWNWGAASPRDMFRALVSLYERMPRQNARTTETRQAQQYSTPPPLAWVGSVLADFGSATEGVTVDPTAGHGMLLIGAFNPWGNELLPGRRGRLGRFLGKALPGGYDATSPEFQDVLTRMRPARLAMNPPFGSVLDAAGNPKEFPLVNAVTKAKTTTSIDVAIALNALETMPPDGKAFVIIGAKTGTPFGGTFGTPEARAKAYRRPAFLEFFERFQVADWFTIGGDLYRKMGAAWPVDMIIVRGKGRTPKAAEGGVARPWVNPPRVIESWAELAELLPANETDQIKTPAPRPGGSGGQTRLGADAPGSGPGSSGPGRPGAPALPTARPQPPLAVGGSGGGGGGIHAERPAPTPEPPAGVPADAGASVGEGSPQPPGQVDGGGAPGGTGLRGMGGNGPVHPGAKPVAPAPSVPTEGLAESLMVPYVGRSRGPSLNLVAPRNIAGQMLEAQNALERDLGMPVDKFVADRLNRDVATLHGQLAGAQIDGVALAIRNIERGGALVVADETGVGKGRMVAALIEYARMRGLVPVFVTAKKNLYTDMVSRDLPAVGNRDFVPFITDGGYTYEDGRGKEVKAKGGSSARAEEMAEAVRTGNLPKGAHAIFTTFDQLKADRPASWRETPKEKFSRKGQRIERPDGPRWAMLRAFAPRSIFILDEAHIAAGKDSELNLKFESVLPLVQGSYYSSATFAKRPDNLGLYALGTSIRLSGLSGEQLTEALVKGGVPLQQALTSMLASTGELVRRQQDWTGVPFHFEKTTADPTAEIEAADSYTQYLRDLTELGRMINQAAQGLEDGENQIRPDEAQVAVEPMTFGSRLFNLSNQYLFALRARTIVEKSVKALREGRKPFIAVYNTMEGPIADMRAMGLPVSFNGILVREMHKMLVLTVRDPMADGGKRKVELTPESLPDGGDYFRALEAQIRATDFSRFPVSPIDFIKRGIGEAGFSIGEITARSSDVDDTGDEVTVSKRDKKERNKILKSYNDGELDALIVNGSGSTGLSAHTDPKFRDQRQREMIVGQPAPDINEFMQMLGRVMRSGQTSKPVYRILSTALAADRRFATMLRGKMVSLNANTTAEGESQMTGTEGFADDIFNEIGDRVVEQVLIANPEIAGLMNLASAPRNEEEALVDFARFATGRFVLLPNAQAEDLWQQIQDEYRAEIARLDERGQNPLRAVAEDLQARTLESTEFAGGTGTTPFDGPAVLERVTIRPPKAPPTHEEAVAAAQANIPVVRAAAQEWIRKGAEVFERKYQAAVAAGRTSVQLDAMREANDQIRARVAQAFRMLGETWGVDALGDGSISFYGVAVDLKLRGDRDSDFAASSRQELVLRTNQFKGRLTIPLSKLFAGHEDLLKPVGDEEAAELYRSTAESSAERWVVTGNLLRGWERADMATSGREGRPRVAMFTRSGGGISTGIIMPTTWSPAANPAGVSEVMDAGQWQSNLRGGIPMRSLPASSVHPVILPAGGMLSLPAAMSGRALWGDPAFNGFFDSPPAQRGGQFLGRIAQGQEVALFEFLRAKSVRMATMPADAAAGLQSAGARGIFVAGVKGKPGNIPPTNQIALGGMQHVRALEMPELVRLARELAGDVPRVKRLGPKTSGYMKDGTVALDPRIFLNPEEAAQVLAHELGHLVDYLPDATLKRGNLLGHLHALRGFLLARFGASAPVAEIRKELMALTMWWRPYNPATDPKTYVAYRATPEELYADALSVLLNAPDQLEARCPKFYAEFWKGLDARAEVRDALFGIQDLLSKGRVATAQARAKDLDVAFAEGERRWKAALAERREAGKSFRGFWTHFLQGIYWQFYPLEKLAKEVDKRGVSLRRGEDPRVFLDELGYRDVTVMGWGRRLYERVIQPAESAGITLDDLGKVLFYDRVLNGDRSGLANPGGTDPAAARLGLLTMSLEMGLPKMTLLRASLDRFHEMVFQLSKEAVAVGAYSKEVFKSTIEPNRTTYATFAVLDYLQDHIPPGIKEQIGTLKDIANPFQATVLKSIGLMHLIAWQRAKNQTVRFLRTYFPGQVEKVPTDRQPPPKDHAGILTRLENGRPVHYKVDQYVADSFKVANPRDLWRGIRLLDSLFRKVVYPFIITYNIPFLFALSPARDLRRTALNSGDLAFPTLRLLRDYVGQLRTAGRRYLGTTDPLVREMEANMAVGTPFDQLVRANRDDFMADLLQRMRVLPDDSQRGFFDAAVFKPVRWVLDGIEFGGLTLDFLAKVAAYKRLRRKGVHPKDAAVVVRNEVGLPNINKKGRWTSLLRGIVPFINVAIQGWRADAKVMTSPNTAGGWWLKWALSDGMLKVLMAAASAGLLGSLLKELMDGIGEYDKENYLVVPLGKTTSREQPHRTVYLRMPMPEHSRVVGGLVYRALAGLAGQPSANSTFADMIDFGMGQMPGVNPLLSVPSAWMQAAAGINPRDPGTGREVIGRREWSAGGKDALESLGVWSLNEMGMLSVLRWDPTAATASQVTLSAMPGVSKFLKTSDQGFREMQRVTMSQEDAFRARQRLAIPGGVQAVELEYWHLARLPARLRTERQAARLEELGGWYRNVYKPAWDALEQARQEGREVLAPSIRRQLEQATEGFKRR